MSENRTKESDAARGEVSAWPSRPERALFWVEFATAAEQTQADPDAATQESADHELWDSATTRDTMDRG